MSSLSGTSGSGKTFSGLLLAAGLAGPKGRVGMLDAENKRGSLYADDPDIMKALPDGYERDDIFAPYTPAAYTAKIVEAEKAGITVLVIDSTSHEWEGEDGCADIAENNKLRGMPNWALAKREHKKFLYHCLSSRMHFVFCLRAREKVTMLNKGDKFPEWTGEQGSAEKQMVIPMGIQPITEKNFVFEMLLSLAIDERSHFANGIKVPKMLAGVFPGGRMITKADGDAVRVWNEGGRAMDAYEQLQKRARIVAEGGVTAYAEFYKALSAADRKAALVDTGLHAELKKIAEHADKESAEVPEYSSFEEAPDPLGFTGTQIRVGETLYVPNEEKTSWRAA